MTASDDSCEGFGRFTPPAESSEPSDKFLVISGPLGAIGATGAVTVLVSSCCLSDLAGEFCTPVLWLPSDFADCEGLPRRPDVSTGQLVRPWLVFELSAAMREAAWCELGTQMSRFRGLFAVAFLDRTLSGVQLL